MNFIGPFYDYFINKHGIEVFNEIKDLILSKVIGFRFPIEEHISKDEFLKAYVIFVFEIAVTDYWGMKDEQIEKYIHATMSDNIASKLSISRAKKIHADAIRKIQRYLKQTTKEVMEDLKNG